MELRVSSKQFSSRSLSAWHHFENLFATHLSGYPMKAVSRYLSLQTANSVASWGCCYLRVMLLEGDAPCRWWPSLETWSEDPPEAGFQLVKLIFIRWTSWRMMLMKRSKITFRVFWCPLLPKPMATSTNQRLWILFLLEKTLVATFAIMNASMPNGLFWLSLNSWYECKL